MNYRRVADDYLAVRAIRLRALAARSNFLRPHDVEQFEELEDKMNAGDHDACWVRSFQVTNDVYIRLLQRILEAAVKISEPRADQKYQMFLEEKGTMGPAVYMTPWDLTLADLDAECGAFEEVRSFYAAASQPTGPA